MAVSRRSFLSQIGAAGGYGAAFSVMQAMGLLGAAQASALPMLPADHGRGRKVVILGAGPTGLVAAYELRKTGFDVTVLEANGRVGGRAWTARTGTQVQFMDGSVQHCGFDPDQYFNMGPARIPSIHHLLLDYCRQLHVPMEVEINMSRSALMQADVLNQGKPVTQRRVIHDMRGGIAELLEKAIDQRALDQALSGEDLDRLRTFLNGFGQLDKTGRYRGGEHGGYAVERGAGTESGRFFDPLPLHELLDADLTKGFFYEDELDWQATMFQPVGGMDRIWQAFARELGSVVQLNSPVSEIINRPDGVQIAYRRDGVATTLEADFAICTMPAPILARTGGNIARGVKAAAAQIRLAKMYKVGWQAPRFWERTDNIYGGISFLKQDVDLVWYPSGGLFTEKGVIVSGFGTEDHLDSTPNSFGMLSTPAKIAASRRSVELLHPGCGKLLEQPVYISWAKVPYFEGGMARIESDEMLPQYNLLNKPDGRVWFAGDWLTRLNGWQEGAVHSAHRALSGLYDYMEHQPRRSRTAVR
jgi:monoamine oxidase